MQMDQDKLKTDNSSLVSALREKSRKHQQMQELYDRLKRKEMTTATQSAAFESVDEVLQSASNHQARGGIDRMTHGPQLQTGPIGQPQRQYSHFPADYAGIEQAQNHMRDSSNGSGGSGRFMPPPLRRPAQVYGNAGFGSR